MKKKSVLYLLLVICSIGLLFSSCGKEDIKGDPDQEQGGGDDDTDDPVLPVEKELAGTYKGLLGILVDGNKLGEDAIQKIYISKSALGDNLLKLELKNFSFGPMSFGDINVDSCAVTLNEKIYSFSGNVTLALADPIGTCPINVKGTIEEGNINIDITVAVAALGQDVVAKFAGSKMTGNENTEAKILTYIFDNNLITEQPAIDEDNGEITFKVIDSATDEDLKALIPTITISEKATITPASEEAQDFSNGKKVTYTVVSEDGTVKTYEVSVAGKQSILKYSFEEWVTKGTGKAQHEEPESDQLASSVEGASLLYIYGVEGFPVCKSEDKKSGNYAIKLVTMDTSEAANSLVPAITSGSVFTGKFDLKYAFSDKLSCTQFGIPYDKKPIKFKGWYKYTPGTKFIDGTDYKNIIEVSNKTDECAIQAVLYKVDRDNDVLTGHDINDSPKRVAVAALTDGTAKAEYTEFDIPFVYLDGKTYEEGAKYKLAIVCSSSKEGDFFKGAGGSTLILDEIEVLGE